MAKFLDHLELTEQATPSGLPASGGTWLYSKNGRLYFKADDELPEVRILGDDDIGGLYGPQGAQGAQGVTGPQGTTGSQGAQGAAGVNGLQGPQGYQGAQGSPSNVPGPQGATGSQGEAGAQGSAGSQGPQGFQGNTGPQGSDGAASTVQGPQGNQGSPGSQGPQGVPGTVPTNVVVTDFNVAQTMLGRKTFGVGLDTAGGTVQQASTATSGTPSTNSQAWSFNTTRWTGTAAANEPIALTGIRNSSAAGDLYLNVNAPLRATALWDNGNRVYSPGNLPPAPANMVTTDTSQLVESSKTFTSTYTHFDKMVSTTAGSPSLDSAGIIFRSHRWTGTGDIGEPIIVYAKRSSSADGDHRLEITGKLNTTGNILENGNRVYSAGNKVPVSGISATGTADATTYLRGDGTWQSVAAGGTAANVVTSALATAHKMTVAPAASPPANPAIGDVWVVPDAAGTGGGVATDLSNYVTLDSAQTIAGIKTFSSAPVLPDLSISIAKINATGTRDSNTLLRGDGTWGAIAAPPIPFSYAGAVTVKTGVFKFPIAQACIVESVMITAGTASAGASIIADVNKNGTTIYTTQANRPTLAAGAVIATAGAAQVTALAAGDYLTVDIDQVGSTTAGADVMVVVRIRRT